MVSERVPGAPLVGDIGGPDGIFPVDFLFSNISEGMLVRTGGIFGLVWALGRLCKGQGADQGKEESSGSNLNICICVCM